MKLIICLLFVSYCCSETWDSYNDPSTFSSTFHYEFSTLPTSGQLSNIPWSDTYWPSFQSGIAHRWNSQNPTDFSYKTYSEKELLGLSISQLKTLSPAEKYDIFQSRYDYPTVNSEWKRTSSGDDKWEGLCHGWAPASLTFKQPNPITVRNAEGIDIPFGSSDIKALLIYFAGEYQDLAAPTPFIAQRCQYNIDINSKFENSSACRDLNAGSLHVLLTNQLGEMNEGFVIDRDRSIQVWNQPMVKFESISRQISTSIESASSTLEISTKITYAKETSPQWETHEPYLLSEKYVYNIELDSQGRIVGGNHVTHDRPDFAWKMQIQDFKNYFSGLKQIYQNSTGHIRTLTEHPRKSAVNHITVNIESCFGSLNYPNNHYSSWSVVPSQENINKNLLIQFKTFFTERYRDKVKIYEGSGGVGPLVGVFHGEKLPEDIEVKSSSAFIVFISDDIVNGTGFEACVNWI